MVLVAAMIRVARSFLCAGIDGQTEEGKEQHLKFAGCNCPAVVQIQLGEKLSYLLIRHGFVLAQQPRAKAEESSPK